MNNENLIPFGKDPERDREIRRKGQQAQAEKKRQRRTLKEDLIALLGMKCEDEDKTYQDAMITAILSQAINGNVKAATFVRDTIGEKPVEKVENTITSENKEALDSYLKEVKNGKSKNT